MEIFDDRGTKWHVTTGDPAIKLVRDLNKRGLELIVLPRKTLITGEITASNPCSDYVHNIRMKDCLTLLRGA